MMRPRIVDAVPIPGQLPVTLYRDDDYWVVNKPAGWLTHGDGRGLRPDVVSWLDARVGVHHRLDVDTSGVLVFSRSSAGAKVLDEAWRTRQIEKRYLAVTDTAPTPKRGLFRGAVPAAPGKPAETRYAVERTSAAGCVIGLTPITGRTHQIRAHLAAAGCPIRGDARYGDPIDRRAPRALLHCETIGLPQGPRWTAPAPPDFALALGLGWAASRAGLEADPDTTCYRLCHGAADGHTGWSVDRYADWLWVQHDEGVSRGPLPDAEGVYMIDALRDRSRGGQQPPRLDTGRPAPDELVVMEHGTRYRVQLGRQLSTGLFLDQRPQRAWLARNAHGLRVLNTFAHAGGFSIAAASAGAQTVSVDLSKSWLARIPGQLRENGVDPTGHDTIYGDVFDWIPRLAKRGERFDLVILDPPSTSVGTRKKRWSVARNYGELAALGASMVSPGGALWTVTNHRKSTPNHFARQVSKALSEDFSLERVCPQAVDFPCAGSAPVKTLVWRKAP